MKSRNEIKTLHRSTECNFLETNNSLFIKMDKIKAFVNILDAFFLTVWGFNMIEYATVLFSSAGIMDGFTFLDGITKQGLGIAGFIYFIFRIHHYYHNSRLDREIKKENLRKIRKENDV